MVHCPLYRQLWGVSGNTSNWFENHQSHRTLNCTVPKATFIENLANGEVILTYFCNSCNIQSFVQTFRLTGLFWYDGKRLTWLLELAVQFCFHLTFESSLTVAWFTWTNHNSLLSIATNRVVHCVHVRKNGQKSRVSSYNENVWDKKSVICSMVISTKLNFLKMYIFNLVDITKLPCYPTDAPPQFLLKLSPLIHLSVVVCFVINIKLINSMLPCCLSKPRRRRQRERHQTKGLTTRTKAVQKRYKSLNVSLSSSLLSFATTWKWPNTA